MKWLIYVLIFLCIVAGAWWFFQRESSLEFFNHDLKKYNTENFTVKVAEQDKKTIFSILDIMANNNVLSLGLKKSNLEKMGASINHVPPLEYLAVVFTNSKATKDMKAISTSGFKWRGFIKGFSKSMMKAHDAGKLEGKLVGFSHYLHIDPQKTVNLTLDGICLMQQGKGGFEGLVRYLIKEKS